MLHAFVILAQEGDKGGGGFSNFIILLPIILMLYLLIVVLPGRRRQEKERLEMITKMTKNDKVLTAAGIYGTVVGFSETEDEVTVKVDDATRLRMTKASIVRNFTKEEEAKKLKDEQKKK